MMSYLKNSKQVWLSLLIAFILIGVTGCFFDSGIEDEVEDDPPVSNVESNTNQKETENSNTNTATNTDTNKSNSSQTKQPRTSLKCVLTMRDQTGTYLHQIDYKFDNAERLLRAESRITVTLNSGYMNQRDAMINEIKTANRQFTSMKGISDSSSKTSDGFIYSFIIDGSQVSDKDLAQMGYSTRNYAGAKVYAYNNGYTCK